MTVLPLQNKIVTRGFGTVRSVPESSGLIVQGYGSSLPLVIISSIERPIRLRTVGQSGTKRRLAQMDDVIVWAKLTELNGKPSPVEVEGFVHVKVNSGAGFASVMAEHVSSRARAAWETIKVTVQRLK